MATATIVPTKNGFLKFHQFAKLEDSKDGAPTVWGVATWEKPDSDNEVADYETAKPVYQAWSSKALKRTKGAGQEASLGNIRVQHGSEVGGKATKLEFDDSAKEIWLGSEPIDDAMHQQLKKGFYTGYSQGGSYAWRACDKCETPLPLAQGQNYCPNCDAYVVVRYGLKRLAEVSYVDSPATGEGFEHVKANGSTEILKFAKKENTVAKTKTVAGVALPSHCFAYVGDPEKTETWKLPIEFPGDDKKTKSHIRNALARFEQTQGIPEGDKSKVKAKIEAAARSHGIEVDGEKAVRGLTVLKDGIDKAAESQGLAKGLYDVARFADVLGSMAWLYECALFEREIEGDESEVPDELKDLLEGMVETFIAMATEEARELSAKQNKGEKTMTPEELQKQQDLEKAAKKSLASHFAKAASHHEKMADKHEAIADMHEEAAGLHQKMADNSECKCGKSTKADGGDVNKEDVGSGAEHMAIHDVLADQQTYHKAMGKCEMTKAKHHDGVAKAHDAMAAHYDKMAAAQDEDSAKATKSEIAAEDAAFAKANPEPVDPPAPKPATMDDDVKKAADAMRDTPEYKASIAAIAKAQVEAEVAKLRDSTLAPLGVQIDEATGQSVIKGLKIVPRDDKKEDFAFAGTAPVSNTAGL